MIESIILGSIFGILALAFYLLKKHSDKVRKQMMKELDEVSND